MTSILRLRTPIKGVTLPAEVQHAVARDTPTGGEVVAYVEVDSPAGYRAERKLGIRRFRLWGDKDRRQPLATVTTRPGATKKQATYLVHRASGEPLAAITRERGSLFRFARTRWTIQLPGQPAVVGYKGKIGWWMLWWLLSPIQAAIAVASLLAASGDVARMPLRTIWRSGDTVLLDYRSDGESYTFPTEWLDPITAAAVVALHRSHVTVLSHPAWDIPPRGVK